MGTAIIKADTFIPAETSKAYVLLTHLIDGVVVDPIFAVNELNLLTVNARVSELRKMGWPIRDKKVRHPKLKEWMKGYFLDAHFRYWFSQNPESHPGEYPDTDGRGKFEGWSAEDFKRGHKIS